MAPGAHLLISWLFSVNVFKERRERVLVTVSGIAPDIDGLGLVIDKISGKTNFFMDYHHLIGHGFLAAAIISLATLMLSKTQRGLVFLSSLFVFHLHVLCDVIGSRGPDGYQWPIYYLYPLDKDYILQWSGQWQLNAWQNQVVLIGCLIGCVYYVHARQITFFELLGSRFNNTAVQMYNKLIRRSI